MKLTFLGAAKTVTGSKYLVETNGKKYLIDCGLFQGQKALRLMNWEPFPVDPKSIEAIILTHAHLDHTGYIPLLVKQGFKGKIYATAATRDLSELLLLDSGKIQEEDARQANSHGYSKHKPALPLYTEEEAKRAMRFFHVVDFDEVHTLPGGVSFSYSHSGHILGSALVTLKDHHTKIVFSGDLGRPLDPVLIHPVKVEEADYVVIESTYGNRLHPKVDVMKRLEEIITSTFAKGGSVIIPAFAVGRTQVLLYYIYRLKQENRLPAHTPIYLDSPMATNATALWNKHVGEHRLSKEECARVCSVATCVRTPEESKALDRSSVPSIIISASGMAEGGRVLYHLAHFAPKEETTVVFTGYQAAGTRGAQMLQGAREIKLHGRMIPVRARIENLDMLSSHADYEESIQWLKGFQKAPKELFLTHGEEDAARALKERIEEKLHWKVTVPNYLDSFNLA